MFLAELRKLAVTCKFGKLDISLRDQLIFGLTSELAQKRIFLEDDDVALDKVVQIAVSQEQAEASTQQVRGGADLASVEKVFGKKGKQRKPSPSSPKPRSSSSSCPNCGGAHEKQDCTRKNSRCRKCNKKGHFAGFCRSGGGPSSDEDASSEEGGGQVSRILVKSVKVGNPHRTLDHNCSDPLNKVRKNQDKARESFPSASLRQFRIGDSVWIQFFAKGDPKWSLGKVVRALGPVTYEVKSGEKIFKLNVDQISAAPTLIESNTDRPPSQLLVQEDPPVVEQQVVPEPEPPQSSQSFVAPQPPVVKRKTRKPHINMTAPPVMSPGPHSDPGGSRFSGRERRPPERFTLD